MINDPRFSCQMFAYQDGEEVLYCLNGVLRMQNCDEIKSNVVGVLARDGVKTLYLNMALLSEIDSAGLGILVGLHMTSRKLKKELKILSPTAYQLRLLEGTRLTAILSIIMGLEAETVRSRLEKSDYQIPIEKPVE